MQRILGLAIATLALSSLSSGPAAADAQGSMKVRIKNIRVDNFRSDQGRHRGLPIDVTALLTAAKGAPAMVCALAANAIGNSGWGGWNDAPSTPLSAAKATMNDGDFESNPMPASDLQQLYTGLASEDRCVRELSVRLIGTQKAEVVGPELVSRLGSGDTALRAVAALGLGLVEAQSAIDPLIRTLRDGSVDVRANSAWALGRIENGRSLAPLVALFGDAAEKVRLAAVSSVGQMDDSTSSIPALVRVLRQDASPAVRRVAAWALGNLEAREGVTALIDALARDSDSRVREMSAWALGNIEDGRGVAALGAAIRGDAEERVRETAVWGLGNIGDRSAMDILAAATADRNPNVRGTAAWAIGNMDDEGAHAPPGLLKLLHDEDTDTRLKAAWALGQLEDASALPAIRDALKVEKNDRVRRALIRALMKSGESSQETLTQLLSSSDPQIREAAVRGIAGAHSFDPWPWPWPRPRPFP
ncbi:MAG TPA: HEAT repeat domain-containing protein [Gemmatimonadaceae bacterium]